VARSKDTIPDAIEALKEKVKELIAKLVKAGTPPVILLDAISEVHDFYTPPVLALVVVVVVVVVVVR